MSILKRKPRRLEFDTQKFVEGGKVKQYSRPSAYDLDSFLEKEDFRVDWDRRRVRIDLALLFLGFLIGVIVCGMLLSVFREKPIDPNLSYVFSGAVWALLLSFVTILGTYCFGPSFEANNVRRAMATMYASSMTKGGPMVDNAATATTTTTVSTGQGEDG